MGEITLDEFIEKFGGRIKINKKNYPHADLSTAERKQVFTVDHGLKHLMKGTGGIARISEAIDHGAPLNEEQLKTYMATMLVTIVNLAHKFQVSGSELAMIADREMNSK